MSEPYLYSDDYPQIQNVEVTDNEIFVEWTRCKYPGNFDSYELFTTFKSTEFMVINIDGITDTSITFAYNTEAPSEIKLTTKSKTIQNRANQITNTYVFE